MDGLSRSGKWFHTLVVVGASMSACGGKSLHDSEPAVAAGGGGAAGGGAAGGGAAGGGRAGSGGATQPSPNDCALDSQFTCDDFATLSNCRCNEAAPTSLADCAHPLDFTCTALPCASRPGSPCIGEHFVGCRCDPSGLRPEACAAPEQFYCLERVPYFRDCSCRDDLPTDASGCGREDEYCCQSSNPRFGCGCFCAVIK